MNTDNEKPIIISKKDINKIKFNKNMMRLPILETALIHDITDKTSKITITDLETANTLTVRNIEGVYPDYEQVMPNKEHLKCSLHFNLKLLNQLLSVFKDCENVTLEMYRADDNNKYDKKLLIKSDNYTGVAMALNI
jgi:DNA polymerase III sliding clamp (beta) subunit (PCNA family)